MQVLDETLQLLKDLTDANGVPGNEVQVKKVMKKYLEGYVDEFIYDRIGSIIAKKVGEVSGPSVVIAGHLDEVGFMVTSIDEKGFIKFHPLGGWWNQVMLAQQVTITTSTGKSFHGIIGSKPPHILSYEERNKPVDIKHMYIDLGVGSKEDVVKLGIKPGDMITPYIEFRTMADENYLLAKAWDNRFGCAIAVDVLRHFKNESHPNTLFGVGTVQEEVGCRGAKTTSQIINPDIVFALDVGIAQDTPGSNECKGELGKGPQIILMDSGLVGHKELRELVIQTAEAMDIPYQLDTISGSTDASAMHLVHNGAPALSLCIPSRYIHSHTSMIHREDYDYLVKLLVAVVKKLDAETVKKITYGEIL